MNRKRRFRSHHDAEHALRTALQIPSRRPAGAPMGHQRVNHSLESLLKQPSSGNSRGVYLHIPFCDTICTFCNMNRKVVPRSGLGQYSSMLVKEFIDIGKSAYVKGKPFEVVYFGGGTPTVFPPAELEMVLNTFTASFPLSNEVEWTVETTLHNLSDEKIEMLENAGVNRLSIGVQTFADRGRKLLGRTGDQETIVTRLDQVRRLFSGVLGIDIIYSYPEQTNEELKEDLFWIDRLGIDGVSFYSLMIQKDSTLSRRIQDGRLLFDRSIASDLHLHNQLYEGMAGQGFELLELTKTVRPGRDEYRYIKVRYNNGDLLPLGIGAGGRIGDHQIYRMAPGKDMIAPVNKAFDNYHLLLGYLQYGIYDTKELSLRSPGVSPAFISKLLNDYETEGYLKKHGTGSWRLTPNGVFWGNNLAVDFLQKIIQTNTENKGVIHETVPY